MLYLRDISNKFKKDIFFENIIQFIHSSKMHVNKGFFYENSLINSNCCEGQQNIYDNMIYEDQFCLKTFLVDLKKVIRNYY